MSKNIFRFIIIIFTLVSVSCSEDDSSVIDGLPAAVVNNDPPGSPPRGVNKFWNNDSLSMRREYFDGFTAVYYDTIVDRTTEWPFQLFSDTWTHVIDSYGDFGQENVLYVFAYANTGENYEETIFEEVTEPRSQINFSLEDVDSSSASIDIPIKLVSNIVESSSYGVSRSPARKLWGNKFSEIFIYDLYRSLERQEDSSRVKMQFLESSNDSPKSGTFWFRDWFLPIYEMYDGSIAINNFFRISSQNFPIDGESYARDMNIGELVHFFSGATGDDLQLLAEEAFGWSDEFDNQLLQAQAEFPNLDYPFEPASELNDFTDEATITVSKDNAGGPEGDEGSLKLIDGDVNTKFLTDGFPQEFWMQQNFPEAQAINRYTLTSGNDAPDRDLESWTLSGSNDGENFEVLDTRTEQSWNERNQTREFTFDNETAYLYYRLDVQSNSGSTLLQVSEWRLLNLSLIDFGPKDITDEAELSVTAENGNGANGAEGSLKLIDNDFNTKFLTNWTPEFSATLELPEERILSKYSLTSGNDAPDRDMQNWEISGSNDGENFEVIDTRIEQTFEERNQTKEFFINSDAAYKFYRWSVTELNNGTVFQVSELRLFSDN